MVLSKGFWAAIFPKLQLSLKTGGTAGSAHLLVSLSLSHLKSSQVLLFQPQSPSPSGPSLSFT